LTPAAQIVWEMCGEAISFPTFRFP
jgi:hypothetical protein